MKKLAVVITSIIAAAACAAGGFLLYSNNSSTDIKADGSCNVKAMIIGSGTEAERTKRRLTNGIIANIDLVADIDAADIVYVTDSDTLDAGAVERYVYNGGTAVLDNSVIDKFSLEFLGAAELAEVEGCPYELTFNETAENLKGISELLYDYADIFKHYENVADYEQYDYGMGIIPSTAEVIAGSPDIALYTRNSCGEGNVFITNPFLPCKYTVSALAESESGEPFAAATVTAGTLLDGYYAEYVSKEKYGFAVERTFGSFAASPAAWELHYEDITGIENESLETFTKLCVQKGQMPSYTLARNLYTWFKRAESLTYLEYDNGVFKSAAYEGAYCSGNHVVSAGSWLELDSYEKTDSYFEDDPQYTKRLYPFVTDRNDDGKPDFICGSADGRFYYFEGSGMGDNYETGISTLFTDPTGAPLSVGAYSSPVIFDIDGDGQGELISGAEDGIIRVFESLKTEENNRSMVFEYSGNALETGFCDSMIDAGDLNGDGIVDLAVGSRDGEMRVYYGYTEDGYSTLFADYVPVYTGETRIAPCIYGGELYGGTLEGYIEKFSPGAEGYEPAGYLECDDVSRRGSNRITIGMNCVPRFFDIDGDGDDDLICGSLEYGMAYPIDSGYFPYKDELKDQIEFCKYNNIYMGVHNLTSRYSTPEHEQRELDYQKKAFLSYDLAWDGKGANQHTWFISEYGYGGSGKNNAAYNGTFAAESESGLLWNSGWTPPGSGQVPQSCAENTLPMPVYDEENDFLCMQVSNTPHGNGSFSYMSVKYKMPMLFYNHCDYIYDDEEEQERAINKVAELTDKYGYLFVGEDQMAKAVAAAYNTDVKAELDGDDIIISGAVRDEARRLYDENYSECAGVRIVFADGINAEEYTASSDVGRVEDNSISVPVGKGVVLRRGKGGMPRISEINIPASVSAHSGGATVEFCEGGLMCARVRGEASTDDDTWSASQKDGFTTFMKFGPADKLKIKYS